MYTCYGILKKGFKCLCFYITCSIKMMVLQHCQKDCIQNPCILLLTMVQTPSCWSQKVRQIFGRAIEINIRTICTFQKRAQRVEGDKVTWRFLFRVSGLLFNGFEVRFSLKYSQVIGGEGCCRNQKRKQRLIEDTSNLFGTSQSEKENWRLNGTD